MTAKSIIEKATPGQRKQIKRFANEIVARAISKGIEGKPFDIDSAQKIIENGGDFQADVIKSIEKYLYPVGYNPHGLVEQMVALERLFPGICCKGNQKTKDQLREIGGQPLPPHAEGYFLIPRWQAVASTYVEAVEIVLSLIKQTHKGVFYNLFDERLEGLYCYCNRSWRTDRFLEKFDGQLEGCNTLIVPALFSIQKMEQADRWTAERFLGKNEFSLGAFETGCIMLTHPEWLKDFDYLGITKIAGECFECGDGGIDNVDYLGFGAGKVLHWGWNWVCNPYEYCCLAVGFLPKK
ncbi:MAG: hypothetical protein WC470_00760 [Candidatus Paceibacterota bacterium]